MGFLKKFGSIILKATAIAAGVAPIITRELPGTGGVVQVVSQDLQQIASIIMQIEAAGQAVNLPGAQKLIMATPLVAQVLLSSPLLAQHKIKDTALFTAGAQKIADGMVSILNSLEDKVDTTEMTA